MYFAFCGIDGSGKTTVIDNIYEKLKKNYSVCKSKIKLYSRAVFSELSKKIYDNKFEFYRVLSPELIRISVAVDFASHYMNFNEKYKNYDIILCDRHAICYQAYGLAYGVKDMTLANHIFELINEPDLYFFFDIDVNKAVNRLKLRGDYVDEEENPELLNVVKNKYKYLFSKKRNVVYIDASKSIEEITNKIIYEIYNRMEI